MKASLRSFLALAAAAPVVLHLFGRGGEGAWLVLLLFAAPALLGALAARRAGAGPHGSTDALEVAFLTGLGGAFVTPLLPWVFGIDGYSAASVVVLGALFAMVRAWPASTADERRDEGPSSGTWARLLLGAWAAWSVGSALRGFFAPLPEGAPWVTDLALDALLDPFGQRSLVDPARPLSGLLLRLTAIAFTWAGLELVLRLGDERERFGRRLCACLTWILAAGLAVALADLVLAAAWRGDASFLDRGLDRNHRPLLDHNALGTALVVLVPLLVAAALGGLAALVQGAVSTRERLAAALPWLGLALGLLLLVWSRSKSALGAVGLAVLVLVGLLALARGGALRRWFLGLATLGVLAVGAVNLAPDGPGSAVERLSANPVAHDFLRVLRFDAVADYVDENRATIWRGALAVGDEAPLLGVGLGNLPRYLPAHHDPTDPGWFNPRSENAHSQYLQWYAEEGLVGLSLALAVLGLAYLGALRRGLRQGPHGGSLPALAGAAGLVGLALNLALGHALLEPATGLLVAGVLGWLLALAPESGGPLPRPRLAVRAVAVGSLALLPLLLAWLVPLERGRLAPEDHGFGTYPWDFLPGQTPDRARVLGPDARWLQVWESGDVMKIPLRDVRDPRFAEPHRLTLTLDGEVVVADHVLPHLGLADLVTSPDAEVNPVTFLRVERPAGVEPGDVVELRLTSSDWFVSSRMFNTDHRRLAARALPAFFR